MKQTHKHINKAKKWQIALFPFNNAATNVYFAFYSYFTYYAIMYLTGSATTSLVGTVVSAAVVMLVSTFTSLFVPLMRVFDGITDPILGGIMDKTKTKFGKFRPFMIIGNALLAFSVLCMMIIFRNVSISWVRWVVYILSYVIYVIGYTCQCACTKAGQTCLTNDPKQRSQFVIWNMVGQIGSIVLINVLANGLMPIEAICQKGSISYEVNGSLETLRGAAYGSQFYDIMVPIVIILSAIYTIMAVLAISEKDKPEYWGVSETKATMKDYVGIVKNNKEIRWLMISSGFNKLASTIATSGTVAFMLYGCLMGDYNNLYIPFYALCFVFMGIFFLWGSKTAGEKGQKRGVVQFTFFALLFYVGVLVLLCIFDPNNANTHLSLFSMDGGFHLTINIYTIVFTILYGCGYGAFNCCDQLTIPMVADCTDYETYRSGNYVPGIMGTIFSLVDKVISSLQTLLLQIFVVFLVPGLNALPAEGTPYMDGMKLSTIICFCILPMISWIITLICMKKYTLSGEKLREIQAVNAVRKEAIKKGMSLNTALNTWTKIEQVPERFIATEKKQDKGNFIDKLYNSMFSNDNIENTNVLPIEINDVLENIEGKEKND